MRIKESLKLFEEIFIFASYLFNQHMCVNCIRTAFVTENSNAWLAYLNVDGKLTALLSLFCLIQFILNNSQNWIHIGSGCF